jgi:transposase
MNQVTTSSKNSKKNNGFTAINSTVAGIDIGANSIFVCSGKADGSTETREFTTYTDDLRRMIAWLKERENTSAAMESTGVYWIPVYDVLEQEGFEVVLTNAHHVKAVPGRKTDVKDCEWLQKLHSCGLMRGSFRPNGDQLILRGYTRHRANLIRTRSIQTQLMQKAMTQMNIQLRQVVSDVDGETGMRIMQSIVAGERNAVTLAELRDRRCKKSKGEIARALDGNYREEHIFALKQALQMYDFLSTQLSECDDKIRKNIESWEDHVAEAPIKNEDPTNETGKESNVNSSKKKDQNQPPIQNLQRFSKKK